MTDYANEYFELIFFGLFSALISLHSFLMSDRLQVTKETWVPSDLPDLLEDQEAQEGLVVLDLKVFT